jgi:hypothetical protein
MTKEQKPDELDGVEEDAHMQTRYYWIGGLLVYWLVD